MTVEEKFKATVILDKALTNIESDDSAMIIAVNDNDTEGAIMMAGTNGTLLGMVAAMIDKLLSDMPTDERMLASLLFIKVIKEAGEEE